MAVIKFKTKATILIGETNLCIECAKYLEAVGWEILFVVSTDPVVINYCNNRNIKSISFEQLTSIKKNNFYLFSIINSHYIPDWFLKKRRVKLAINYHDSLLPKYAGINSTIWALINNETCHGVTWHLIDKGLDTGDIVEQELLEIDRFESVNTLNIKCAQLALRLFKKIITKIEGNSLEVKPQYIAQRTYYGEKSIPKNYAIINRFESDFATLKLISALNFGPDRINDFCTVKCFINNKLYILENKLNDKCRSGEYTLFDINSNKFTIDTIRDIYGNSNVLSSGVYNIYPLELKHEELQYLSNLKALEKKYLCELLEFKNISRKNKLKKYFLDLRKKIPYPKAKKDFNLVLILFLYKHFEKNITISYYHNIKDYSKTLKMLVEVMSLIKCEFNPNKDTIQDTLTRIKNKLNKRYFIARDYFYRYKINLETDIAISIEGEPCRISNHRFFISIGKKEINLYGQQKDENMLQAINNVISLSLNCNLEELLHKKISHLIPIPCLSTVILQYYNNRSGVCSKNRNSSMKYEDKQLLPHMFERQAWSTPGKIAIVDFCSSLTYGELNKRANQLAHYLIKQGITKNNFVAISTNRSVHLIVSIVAVLKAGAAYVPIEPSQPINRIKTILENADIRYIITSKQFAHKYHFMLKNTLLIEEFNYSDFSDLNLKINISKKDTAYMIYTSGTTGKPKGVMISYNSISKRLQTLLKIYEVDANWKHLQYGSYCFDASLEEIFLGLLSGGQVIIASSAAARDPNLLINLIKLHGITAINFVPTFLQVFLNSLKENHDESSCKTLNCIIVGGETLHRVTVNSFYKHLNAKLYNTYGPTENTINSTYYLCSKKEYQNDDVRGTVPIGISIPNCTTFIFDENKNLTLPGEIGELYVGGVGLAKGYYKSPELTMQKFIDNPLQSVNSNDEVIYRTGDLVKLNDDNYLEFIGRTDQQFKIRGFRIEVEEIKSALLNCSSIKNAVVVVDENKKLGKFIRGYLIPINNQISDIDLIGMVRRELKQLLPHYMIPTDFTIISEIPLKANYKIDFNALKLIKISKVKYKSYYSLSNTEKNLIEICTDELGLVNIQLNNNFFESGGHSLKAIALVSRVNKKFGTRLTIRLLFDNPTIKKFAKIIDDALNKFPKLDIKSTFKLSKINVKNKHIPITYEQQAIWLVQKIYPSTPAYNIPILYEIDELVDISLIKKTLKYLLHRHVVLRSNFKETKNGVYHFIKNIPECFLTNYEGKDPFNIINLIINKPFNLETGPLYRFYLFQESYNNKSLLLFVFHHLIFDGISCNILAKEFSIIYNALLQGDSIKLANLPFQYTDYAYCYRKWQETNNYESQIKYWKEQLYNSPNSVALPYDNKRPKIMTFEGDAINFKLNSILISKLKNIMNKEKVSLYVIFIAAFNILLCKYCNQNDLVIGTAIANRPSKEIDDLIGLFVNTLPLRTQVNQRISFSELLRYMNTKITDILSNTDIPLEVIFNALQIEREIGLKPLFNVLFTLEYEINNKLFIGGSPMKLLNLHTKTSKYDLSLVLNVSEFEISGYFEYNTKLFCADTIFRLLTSFKYILENITNNVFLKIEQLSVTTLTDIKYINSFNSTNYNFNKSNYLLHELFEDSAVLYPNEIAIITPKIKITYQQLNILSNNLANKLIENKAKPNDVIAVIIEKGWEQVVAVLAILKIGSVFLPINVKDPIIRISKILNMSKSRYAIVTHNKIKLDQLDDHIKCIQINKNILNQKHSENIKVKRQSRNMAYIIFTSGSTGEPKGVMISHKGVVNTILDINERFNINSKDRLLGLSQLNFDLSIYDIFGTLSAGSTMILPAPDECNNPKSWLNLMNKYKITVWNSVPAFMQMLIDYVTYKNNISDAIPESLRICLLSGDWIPLNIKEKIHSTFNKEIQVIGLGGATEASIWSVLYPITDLSDNWHSVPYGYPMKNQKIHVLDKNLNMMPLGVPGDLYISGAGTALGYINDKDKTSASFIKHPITNEILYKTGDIGKLVKDGYIIFLGRNDSQIKINGYRIELGEIKAQLLKHDKVDEAFVKVEQNNSQMQSIFAFITLKKMYKNWNIDILNYLEKNLPSYMLPSDIILVDHIPLNSNGKVNLNAMSGISLLEKVDITPMQTETERILVKLWQKVLEINEIGIRSHFFQLGGQSITAIRLTNLIKDKFKLELLINAIFEYPRLDDMASLIDNLLDSKKATRHNDFNDLVDVGVI